MTANGTGTHRKDLHYVQTRTVIKGGTIHGQDCPGWRERVMPKWRWLLHCWQFWRFDKIRPNVLKQKGGLT